VAVVEVLEAAEDGVEAFDVGGQVVGFVELVPPCAIAAFDGSIHLWASGRENIEGDTSFLAGGLELGHELASAVDLDGLHRERHVVEEACGGLCGCTVEGFADGPFGDRVIGGEVLDRFLRGSD
jgi:hypothetical protein